MKLIPITINTTFGKLSDERVVDAVTDAIQAMQMFTDLHAALTKAEEAGESGNDDAEMEMLDMVEAMTMDLSFDGLEAFAQNMAASSDSIQRRLNNGVHYLTEAAKLLNTISVAFIPMTTKQIQVLKEYSAEILAELSYFTFYQYNLDQTQESIAHDKEIEINLAVVRYCDNSGADVKEVLIKVVAIMSQYRPRFTIFEEFPELEDEFYNIAGAYIRDFDTLSEFVTADVVKAVLSGDADVEQVIKSLEASIMVAGEE
jgi:hypothetical protein